MLLKVGFEAWRALVGAIALIAVSNAPALADNAKANAPIPSATVALMAAKNTSPSAPVLIRTYKEAELEVWKLAKDGRYRANNIGLAHGDGHGAHSGALVQAAVARSRR